MKYFVRTVLGLGLELGAIVAISYAVYQLLQVGTCASGGPYEIARECPKGTEWLGLAIPIAVFVMLFGAFLYANRGTAPGSEKKGGAGIAVMLIWTGLFLGIAFACFWGVWGPDANPGPGGKLGGLIVGFLFVPMGLFPLIPLFAVMRRERRGERREGRFDYIADQMRGETGSRGFGSSPPARTDAPNPGSPGKIAELERLQKLREQGAIDQAEFDRLKTEVMGT